MKITKTFKLAFKSIWGAKARSLLTMLGIIIGVAAVIVIVGLGNGMENYMTDSFKSFGTNLITVSITGRGSTRSISVDEMYAIADENPDLFTGMSPTLRVSATVKKGRDEMESTSVQGVSEDYMEMKFYSMSNGRFLQYADNLARSKVCVVGNYISQEWYSGNAVGETIKINGDFYTIVGVLSVIGDGTEGSSDDCMFIPYTTAMKISNTGTVSSYSYAMASEDDVTASKKAIEDVLLERFGSSNSYSVTSMSEMLNTMTTMINMVVMVLTIIAGISLLVGGIGIMNIMLVSVSERTREIGIRKALGAKKRNILSQFIVEAGTTSALGGAFGILIGYLLSTLVSMVLANMDMAITVAPSSWAVMMAFGVSAGIGILFGYLPARKAARLNPIDALRYE